MKKILAVVALILAVFVIQGLVASIWSLWQKQDVITTAQRQLAVQEQQNKQLKSKLQQVESGEFIEEEARDKLFLAKPGESQVILPPASASATIGAQPVSQSNLQQWFALFFYSDQEN